MKRKSAALLIILLPVVAANAQAKKSDRECSGLIGQIRTVTEKTFRLSNSFGKSAEHAPAYFSVTEYDARGNITSRTNYKADGSIASRHVIIRDDKGNVAEVAVYDSGGSVMHKYVYKYDDKDRRTEWATLNPDGSVSDRYVSSYDERGNLVEEIVYITDGSVHTRSVYSYDDRGKMTAGTTYDAQDIIIGKAFYFYDKDGNKTEQAFYDGNGSPAVKMLIKHGEASEETHFEPKDGSIRYRLVYAYEADAAGNWIKRTTFKAYTKLGKSYFEPIEVTHRTFTYY
ncbi:MAG TPA: hypothetical protein VNO70_11165 [Blastocatellia bacterium]|nr:hypothetical protein [Blastocatellia bacterium]